MLPIYINGQKDPWEVLPGKDGVNSLDTPR